MRTIEEVQAGDVVNAPGSPLDGAEYVSVYSRAQAIEDGELVDVSEAAREVGIRYPVALTRAAWTRCVEVPESLRGSEQSERGRLHDVVWMLRCAIGRSRGDRLTYELLVVGADKRRHRVQLVSVCGPGDTAEPVLTVMLPDES